MDAKGVSRWFGEYLDMYGACGRGEGGIADLLPYYAVPLLLTTDDGVTALTTADDVAATMQGQIDGLRAAGYHHTEIVHSEVTVLNATSAIYRGAFARLHSDGTEITRVALTYVVADGSAGLRIAVLAVNSP